MCNTTGFFDNLANWSNSYVNFEMEPGTRVEVKISMLTSGDTVTKAMVRPETVGVARVVDGEALVTIDQPSLFTVDINGQMDDQDTGKLPKNRGSYDGPPIHTVTIFANPIIDKPSLDDPGVVAVSPGDYPPSNGSWHTLYFLPGVHDIGLEYRVHAGKSYYIPGDAIVYGTLSNNEWKDGNNIHIFGHGTLSGDRTTHPKTTDLPEEDYWMFRPVGIQSKKEGV